MKPLAVGARAPEVEVVDATGQRVPLRSFAPDRPLVVFFYPKDDSPGCTKEACSFRDAYEDFLGAGAAVLGISGDGEASYARFASKHRLPFPLASDPDGRARAAFGVGKTLGFIEGRVTFVIDREGVVRRSFSSHLLIGAHVDEALEAVKGLA